MLKVCKIFIYKAANLIRNKGINEFLIRVLEKLLYYRCINRQLSNLKKIQQEDSHDLFKYEPKISIIVPVYNTKPIYLKEMIESVLNQQYTNWELCIFNGGSTNNDIDNVVIHYQKNNKRIVYKKDAKNYGISGNTNRALELASGEYIALLDHDDTLTVDSLYECAKAINDINADFIYSNEDKITEDGKTHIQPHIKSKWAPDTLKSYNFICHLIVFKKELLKETGELRECFDGSQDYDFIIRLTRQAKSIHHIPKVLYHWRISSQSTALNIEVKNYAFNAGKEAVKEALITEKLSYKVTLGEYAGSYRIEGRLILKPKITIAIIGYWTNENNLVRDYKSLLTNISYDDYDLVFINRGSEISLSSSAIVSKINIVNLQNNNYAQIVNYILEKSTTEYIIIKDNDVKIISDKWCSKLVEQAQETYIGVVAPKLLKSKDFIYSYGISITNKKIINNYRNCHKRFYGYMGRCRISQNVTAVSDKLYLIKKDMWLKVGRLDEDYSTNTALIDYCLKLNLANGFIKLIPHELGVYRKIEYISKSDVKKLLKKYDLYLRDYDYYSPIVYAY